MLHRSKGMVGPGLAGGLAIILFTIFLRLVLVPLSLVQIRSQRAQMAIQPELKGIQRKFKGDREGLARAQMALYKERGINPAAGCLPLLIQMPILFGMYAAMNQLATQGMTLDQVTASQIQPGQVGLRGRAAPGPAAVQPVRPGAAGRGAQRQHADHIDVNQDQSGGVASGSATAGRGAGHDAHAWQRARQPQPAQHSGRPAPRFFCAQESSTRTATSSATSPS